MSEQTYDYLNSFPTITPFTVDYELKGLPPYAQVNVLVNQYNFTSLSSNTNDDNFNGSLFADGNGALSGSVYIASFWPTIIIPPGPIRISFVDQSGSIETSSFLAEATIYGGKEEEYTVTIRPNSTLRKNQQGTVKNINASDRGTLTRVETLDPLSQVFSVDGNRFPFGVALTSIDLYFITKDSQLPVKLDLRPTINGVPSTSEIIAGSQVLLLPGSVNIPADPTKGLGSASTFTFDHPIFLVPGDYAFCVSTASKSYTLFTGRLNNKILNSELLVSAQPDVGALYKQQNSSIWTPEINESICFNLKKAVFETGDKLLRLQSADTSYIDFDQISLRSNFFTFGEASTIDFKLLSTSTGGVASTYNDILPNKLFPLDLRSRANVEGDLKVEVTFTNSSKDISPVIDKDKIFLTTDRYYVDSTVNRATILTDELYNANSTARARYVSKVVSLPFTSTGLQVEFEANKKTGTEIDLFYKVIAPGDTSPSSTIDNSPWKQMTPITSTIPEVGLSETTFVPVLFRDLNVTYTNSLGVAFNEFNKYQLKIVFFSDTPSRVPKIRNLIATSVV